MTGKVYGREKYGGHSENSQYFTRHVFSCDDPFIEFWMQIINESSYVFYMPSCHNIGCKSLKTYQFKAWLKLRKELSCFNHQGQVVAKDTSHYACEMGANSWLSQRVLGHLEFLRWEKRTVFRPHGLTSNTRGFKQTAKQVELVSRLIRR